MVVTHGNGYTHGYPIDRVERRGDRTWVHLGMDPGLRIEGDVTQEVCFPRRRIEGRNRFVIHNLATLRTSP
jgi:hypothetical protein